MEGYRTILLVNGGEAIVDAEDYEYLAKWKWRRHKEGYACRCMWQKGKGQGLMLMHRLINNTPEGFDTDHKDRNRLNNRKCNLRTVSRSINNLNNSIRRDNTTGVKGVHWNKSARKWQAYINLNGRRTSLGYHMRIEDAAKAYDAAAQKIRGL